MQAMLAHKHLSSSSGGDGTTDPGHVHHDQRAGYGHEVDYQLTTEGQDFLTERMIELDWLCRSPSTRAVRVTETGHTGIADTFGIPPMTDGRHPAPVT